MLLVNKKLLAEKPRKMLRLAIGRWKPNNVQRTQHTKHYDNHSL